MMDWFVLVVFLLVYAGMIAGGFRGLALDRTGIVLLGAIAMVAGGRLSISSAWSAVDVPTIALLFGLMVVSAQFRLGGFYTAVTRRLAVSNSEARVLLFQVLALSGGLSALLANDIVCLAVAPILVELCARRSLNPMPYLLALACGSNIGSAATLIGNPQNMLIGQVLGLSFSTYLLQALVPSVLGLVAAWLVLWRAYRDDIARTFLIPTIIAPEFDRWQTAKGIIVLAALVFVFLTGAIAREVAALAAGGVLLLSRRMASPKFLTLVDWNLLVLFIGLFVVNHALAESGMPGQWVAGLQSVGLDPNHGATLFLGTAVLSNLVSNVPAVMLLLPLTTHPDAGLILALSSTLAGNFILVGSITNLIVADQAGRLGVTITAREHARTGIPITIITLAIAGLWLLLL